MYDNNFLLEILEKLNISCTYEQLEGYIIERNLLVNNSLYKKLYEEIPKIKNILSSSKYNSVHSVAEEKQKWPLINLLRQLLKQYNFTLTPKRISDGYDKDGTKKYKRFFVINKII
jgi:hypothetical protein